METIRLSGDCQTLETARDSPEDGRDPVDAARDSLEIVRDTMESASDRCSLDKAIIQIPSEE